MPIVTQPFLLSWAKKTNVPRLSLIITLCYSGYLTTASFKNEGVLLDCLEIFFLWVGGGISFWNFFFV